jgi:Growth inhibitor
MVTYQASQGDIVWVNFNPQSGHEQSGKRPALVISNEIYNQNVNLIIACPITSQEKDFPLHIKLPQECKTNGWVLCEQIRSLDPEARKVEFIEVAPKEFINRIRGIVQAFL